MAKDWYAGFSNRDVFGGNGGSSKRGAASYTEFASKANSAYNSHMKELTKVAEQLGSWISDGDTDSRETKIVNDIESALSRYSEQDKIYILEYALASIATD